jgi:ATP-dependent Lon protease
MSPASAEAMVIRSHLEWVVDIPWKNASKVNKNLDLAKDILDRDHFGLKDIKQRSWEHLAVHIKSKQASSGAILCFVGPPGVGKTSLGKSIAEAMGRKYIRIALGGVRDEAEIRGHRKTYIGAMPGRIIKAMKRSGVTNPLILLDEIDKLGMDFRGDPASALLEVLDPEQNKSFNDHYLELDYDLSKVVFIATANTLDIPDALLDRMEVINLTGYIDEEKFKIAKNYLLPKSMEKTGVDAKELSVSDKVIFSIIQGYTRESGVRAVEKCLTKICRKVAYDLVKNSKKAKKKQIITVGNLKKYLGVVKFEDDIAFTEDKVGLVNGMAWTSVGGVLLTIEALAIHGKGDFKYTGSLGDVMQESMQAALTVVKSRSEFLSIDVAKLAKLDIHVHVPEGATPKDGPSAGAAICVAIVSALTGVAVKKSIAITGELTLRGELLKIGGLKEKLLAALRAGAKLAIIPESNLSDLEEISYLFKNKLEIRAYKWIDEVLACMLVNNKVDKNITKSSSLEN